MKRKVGSAGFSLVEVVVALGIMALAGYFLASMLTNGARGQKTLLAQDDARNLTDNILGLLMNPAACEYTFGDGTPPLLPPLPLPIKADPSTASGTSITNVYDAHMNVQYTLGGVYGNRSLSLVSITIGGTSPALDAKTGITKWILTSPSTGTAFVQIVWQQTGSAGSQSGPSLLYRFALVSVNSLNGTKISTCVAQPAGTGSGYWSLNGNNIYNNNNGGLGNVGIGVTTPTDTLDVQSPGNTYVRANAPLANQSAFAFSDFTNGQDAVIYRPASTRDLAFYTTTGGNVMYITQAGKVGINNTAPVANLDVQGSMRGPSGTVGGGCSPPGGLGYDSGSGMPLYCNTSSQWALAMPSASAMCTALGGSWGLPAGPCNFPLTQAQKCAGQGGSFVDFMFPGSCAAVAAQGCNTVPGCSVAPGSLLEQDPCGGFGACEISCSWSCK